MLLLSSRVKRGICFLSKRVDKADSSGKPGLRNDSLRVYPRYQVVANRIQHRAYVFAAGPWDIGDCGL